MTTSSFFATDRRFSRRVNENEDFVELIGDGLDGQLSGTCVGILKFLK